MFETVELMHAYTVHCAVVHTSTQAHSTTHTHAHSHTNELLILTIIAFTRCLNCANKSSAKQQTVAHFFLTIDCFHSVIFRQILIFLMNICCRCWCSWWYWCCWWCCCCCYFLVTSCYLHDWCVDAYIQISILS